MATKQQQIEMLQKELEKTKKDLTKTQQELKKAIDEKKAFEDESSRLKYKMEDLIATQQEQDEAIAHATAFMKYILKRNLSIEMSTDYSGAVEGTLSFDGECISRDSDYVVTHSNPLDE